MESGAAEAFEAAQKIIHDRYVEGKHHIGAAVRTAEGDLFSAVHLEAHVGRASICAEAIAIGIAVAKGKDDIDLIVAVDHHGNIVAPCGYCRELLFDYSPQAKVLVPDEDDNGKLVQIVDLLPHKYVRKE